MPRYDYQCQTCQHTFEVKQSFSSEPVANCPVCNNGARRVIHSVPVVFKGSGWYVNDYGKGNTGPNSTSDSKKKEADETKKSEPKAESGSDGESKKESVPAK